VGRPAGDAGYGKHGDEQVHGDAQGIEQRRRVKVDVGKDAPLLEIRMGQDPLFQALGDVEPAGVARALRCLVGQVAEDDCPGIFGLVDAVPEPEEPLVRAIFSSNQASTFSTLPISRSSSMEAWLAPPCRGPFSVPRAVTTAE